MSRHARRHHAGAHPDAVPAWCLSDTRVYVAHGPSSYQGRCGTIVLAAYAPDCVLVMLDDAPPVPLPFAASELAPYFPRRAADHRGRGPIDLDPRSIVR